MKEIIVCGTLTIGEVEQIAEAYVSYGRSCDQVLWQSALPYSVATIHRVIAWADEQGMLAEGIRREPGRPQVDRQSVRDMLRRHPHARTKAIAQLAGVSEATVYRVKRGE